MTGLLGPDIPRLSAARRDPVTDTYHGITVVDPYRWMETDGDALGSWLEEQSRHFEHFLNAQPGQAEARELCARLSAADAHVVNVQYGGGQVFLLRRDVDAPTHRLVARVRPDGEERVVVDPSVRHVEDGAHHVSIDWYSASPDGRFVAYGVSANGSELSTLYVVDVVQGTWLPVSVPGAAPGRMTRLRHPGISWHPDSRRFVYQRLGAVSGTAKYQNMRTEMCEIDSVDGKATTRPLDDIGDLTTGPDDTPVVTFSDDGQRLVVGIRSGCERTCSVHVRAADAPGGPWQQVSGSALAWHVAGDEAYVLDPGEDGRGRIVARSLIDDDAPHTVVFDKGPVVEDFCAVDGALLLRCLEGGSSTVVRVRRPLCDRETISLPHLGSVTEWAHDPATGECLIGLSSWTRSLRLLRLTAESTDCTDTGWVPPSGVERQDVTTSTVTVVASDGVEVPMTVVHRVDQLPDGTAPALLSAYGFFGITLRAAFNPAVVEWVAAGRVWAVAHVRGGGEGGERWARAGHGTGQERTIADFLDCADHLVEAGWTSADRLAAEGTSAGGLTAAGAMVRSPDRFAAVVLRVPVTTTLRLEMHENGPPNIPEYGTVTTPEGLAALLVSDVCRRVTTAPYPPVLVTMGLHDPRVTPFQPAKLVAHLRYASTSTHPVLLRVEEHAGHGVGSTKSQLDNEIADRLTFLNAVLPQPDAVGAPLPVPHLQGEQLK
ncbi:prolyl oligopeptidase family serine peptidase [Streptomyces canus]|uniref:prolyl oligopeptidase family serine peptidase n=1 Tax=Streptomyces canus TaxID=58343 RepID=UPI0033B3F349